MGGGASSTVTLVLSELESITPGDLTPGKPTGVSGPPRGSAQAATQVALGAHTHVTCSMEALLG